MLNSYPETNGPVSRLIRRSGLQSISSEQASLEPPKIRKRGYITPAFCRATVPATADAAVFDDIRHGIAQASGGRFVHWPSLKVEARAWNPRGYYQWLLVLWRRTHSTRGTLVVGRVFGTRLGHVILQILGHLQMRLEHGDRLLDIEFHIRIALELPLRTLERAESFLVSLYLISEIGLVESAPLQVFQRAFVDLVRVGAFELDALLA